MVYLLNGQFPDTFLGDEHPVPLNADPHPEHGPIALRPHPVEPNWQQEVNEAANNLGFWGANPTLILRIPSLLIRQSN